MIDKKNKSLKNGGIKKDKKEIKKTVPKWNRKHEFKKKKSTKRAVGHPVYVIATNRNNSKYLTFTHKPEVGKEKEYTMLNHNIDPEEDKKGIRSFVKNKLDVSRTSKLREPDKKYRIHKEDKETIERLKKGK